MQPFAYDTEEGKLAAFSKDKKRHILTLFNETDGITLLTCVPGHQLNFDGLQFCSLCVKRNKGYRERRKKWRCGKCHFNLCLKGHRFSQNFLSTVASSKADRSAADSR